MTVCMLVTFPASCFHSVCMVLIPVAVSLTTCLTTVRPSYKVTHGTTGGVCVCVMKVETHCVGQLVKVCVFHHIPIERDSSDVCLPLPCHSCYHGDRASTQ